jgi:hypothetical protein
MNAWLHIAETLLIHPFDTVITSHNNYVITSARKKHEDKCTGVLEVTTTEVGLVLEVGGIVR